MNRKDVEKLLKEERDFYEKIYRSFTKKSMPELTPEEVVEICLTASQEELVRGSGEAVLKAYAINVAARVVSLLLSKGKA